MINFIDPLYITDFLSHGHEQIGATDVDVPRTLEENLIMLKKNYKTNHNILSLFLIIGKGGEMLQS